MENGRKRVVKYIFVSYCLAVSVRRANDAGNATVHDQRLRRICEAGRQLGSSRCQQIQNAPPIVPNRQLRRSARIEEPTDGRVSLSVGTVITLELIRTQGVCL